MEGAWVGLLSGFCVGAGVETPGADVGRGVAVGAAVGAQVVEEAPELPFALGKVVSCAVGVGVTTAPVVSWGKVVEAAQLLSLR